MILPDALSPQQTPRPTMPKSKAQKRAQKRKRRAERSAMAAAPVTKGARPGRPKEQREVGPTKETLAKLQPCPLYAMMAAHKISKVEYAAAFDLAEAYHLRTEGCGAAPMTLKRQDQGPKHWSKRALRLDAAWSLWAADIFRRTMVQPPVFVQWVEQDRLLDAGAWSVMAKALQFWVECDSITRRRDRD